MNDAMGQKVLAYDFDSSLAWSYDGANRVVAAAVHGGVGNAQPQTVLTHAWNAVGERVSLSDSEGGVAWYDQRLYGLPPAPYPDIIAHRDRRRQDTRLG